MEIDILGIDLAKQVLKLRGAIFAEEPYIERRFDTARWLICAFAQAGFLVMEVSTGCGFFSAGICLQTAAGKGFRRYKRTG